MSTHDGIVEIDAEQSEASFYQECKTKGAIPCSQIKTCSVTTAEMYRKLLAMHCARSKEPGHQCQGKVSIDHKGITLQCPRCGDGREVFEEPKGA